MVSEVAQHSKIPHSTVHGKMSELIIAMQCGPVPIHTRKISNIRRTKSETLNDYRLVVQLSLPNPMKPGVKSRMKM